MDLYSFRKGGNSFLAARYGLACDNVVNFKARLWNPLNSRISLTGPQVVLANGDIVNANRDENSDLFQALKGGSNNFGIVVQFDLLAVQQPNLWGGVVVYPNSTTPQQLPAFVNFGDRIQDDPYASVISIWSYSSVTKQTLVTNIYDHTKPVPRAPAFDEFLSIPGNTTDTTRISNLTDLTSELSMSYGWRCVIRALIVM